MILILFFIINSLIDNYYKVEDLVQGNSYPMEELYKKISLNINKENHSV